MTDELPEADLLSLISLAGGAIDRRVIDELHAAGFTSVRPAHGYVIQRLLTGPQLITVMAADLGVTQQAVSKMAKELIRIGIVEQRVDTSDSRRRPLILTARGRDAVTRARAIRTELEHNLSRAAGADDLAAAHRVVTTLLGQFGLTSRLADRTMPLPSD